MALALASSGAGAMGLGQLQVKSGLNQPLVAEIPIVSATAAELEQLDVRLASPDAFARVGLDPPGEHTANLQFSVGKNARGQPVIRVSTPTRFTEPLLSFLIEAEWGKGVVTREYTSLVDPRYIAPAVVRPMQTPAIAAAPPAIAPPATRPRNERRLNLRVGFI
jgi:pilus assembly protein FimV